MTMQASELAAVKRSVSVPLPVEKAFQLFTDGIGTWWPFVTHSLGGEETEDAVLEPRVGGLVYERRRDGTTEEWADVTAWDPPHRLELSWRVNPTRAEPTEVEVEFVPEGAGTRVELEHRGWERLEDGPEARANYDTGWEFVLGRYSEAAR